MGQDEDLLSVELSAEPEAVGTARLFAVSVSRLTGVEEETVEDVRLAISEAVTERIHAATDGSAVRVTATVRDKDVEFEISGGLPAREGDGDLSLAVVRSLFPDAEIEPDPPTLRFRALRHSSSPSGDSVSDRGA